MNIVVFDTETTSLDKPFCYNIGYKILDENFKTLLERDYVVEQVWHNTPLFASAYYSFKKPIYIKAMRQKKTVMEKFGRITQQMRRDFYKYKVEHAYAYNSPFDEKVFDFNCDWFKCINPFETIPIHDIRGYAHHFLVDSKFKTWCDTNSEYTESGNYSTTAQTMYRYIKNDTTFEENHTALSDSQIESEILNECKKNGADITKDLAPFTSITRTYIRDFIVKKNGMEILREPTSSVIFKKKNDTVYLK